MEEAGTATEQKSSSSNQEKTDEEFREELKEFFEENDIDAVEPKYKKNGKMKKLVCDCGNGFFVKTMEKENRKYYQCLKCEKIFKLKNG